MENEAANALRIAKKKAENTAQFLHQIKTNKYPIIDPSNMFDLFSHKQNEFICDNCGKRFNNNEKFKKHKNASNYNNIHTGIYPNYFSNNNIRNIQKELKQKKVEQAEVEQAEVGQPLAVEQQNYALLKRPQGGIPPKGGIRKRKRTHKKHRR